MEKTRSEGESSSCIATYLSCSLFPAEPKPPSSLSTSASLALDDPSPPPRAAPLGQTAPIRKANAEPPPRARVEERHLCPAAEELVAPRWRRRGAGGGAGRGRRRRGSSSLLCANRPCWPLSQQENKGGLKCTIGRRLLVGHPIFHQISDARRFVRHHTTCICSM